MEMVVHCLCVVHLQCGGTDILSVTDLGKKKKVYI